FSLLDADMTLPGRLPIRPGIFLELRKPRAHGNCNRSSCWLRSRIRCSRVGFAPTPPSGERATRPFGRPALGRCFTKDRARRRAIGHHEAPLVSPGAFLARCLATRSAVVIGRAVTRPVGALT